MKKKIVLVLIALININSYSQDIGITPVSGSRDAYIKGANFEGLTVYLSLGKGEPKGNLEYIKQFYTKILEYGLKPKNLKIFYKRFNDVRPNCAFFSIDGVLIDSNLNQRYISPKKRNSLAFKSNEIIKINSLDSVFYSKLIKIARRHLIHNNFVSDREIEDFSELTDEKNAIGFHIVNMLSKEELLNLKKEITSIFNPSRFDKINLIFNNDDHYFYINSNLSIIVFVKGSIQRKDKSPLLSDIYYNLSDIKEHKKDIIEYYKLLNDIDKSFEEIERGLEKLEKIIGKTKGKN